MGKKRECLFRGKTLNIWIIFLGIGIVLAGVAFLNKLNVREGGRVVREDELKPGGDKRYLAIGFDDFRDSDFMMVIPMFEEYGAHATFNKISNRVFLSDNDLKKIDVVINNGNELGDHTWYHCNYIYNDPLFNGQNPACPEGGQKPFPTNEQMRNDYGGGRNAFGFSLLDSCDMQLSDWNNYDHIWTAFDTAWGSLTDEECQYIREYFSIMHDDSGIPDNLDELSNLYLGTYGSSKGSWSEEKQCYTGGIYTGCKTSANHEIWERILQVTGDYYENQCGVRPITWSWPGSIPSPFMFYKDGKYYYDEECTVLYNYLAKMPSSIYENEDGTAKMRSWTDALKNQGYKMTHDTVYPSRQDGVERPMMSKQLIYNAFLSREDALAYSTNLSVSYTEIANAYDEAFFDDSCPKSKAAQMYDDGGAFYTFIESIRQNTSNGMVHGEVIDSVDSVSERNFLEEVLEYCRKTGVHVVSKEEAYTVCFDQSLETGNLIYNAALRNTAQEFMPDAENIPNNPDGYVGNCRVITEDGNRVLLTEGTTVYLHYGIPLGDILFSVMAKGNGSIKLYSIKNSNGIDLDNQELSLLGEMTVADDSWICHDLPIFIEDNPKTDFEQVCNGMGNKIMGIKIEYSEGLWVKDIVLEKQ